MGWKKDVRTSGFSLNNLGVNVSGWERWNIGTIQRSTLTNTCVCVSLCHSACVCVTNCSVILDVIQSRKQGQGVTVGVKAPLLPSNSAVDCFTQCPLIWSRYWVSVPRSAERLQPSSPGRKPTRVYTHSRSFCAKLRGINKSVCL